MNRWIRTCMACLAISTLTGMDLAAAQALTNNDVVTLSKLGLGDEVVIAKIRQAPEIAFSLEIADIEKLQQSGVSKGAIAAMLDRSSGGGSGAGPAAPPTDVWIVSTGRRVEIQKVPGYSEASIGQAFKNIFLFDFKSKFALIAKGPKAETRFPTAPTVIYTRYNPAEVGVARFTVQTERDRRYVWVVTRTGANDGEFDPPENNIKFTKDRTSDGAYKLTFQSPLAPGEYGLVAVGGVTGYVVHEFGIDSN